MISVSKQRLVLAAALTAALVGGFSAPSAPSAIALWLFTLFNLFVTPPGTLAVRTVAALYAFPALLFAPSFLTAAPYFIVWLWVPAYLMAWGFGQDRGSVPEEPSGGTAGRNARVAVAAIIVALAVALLFHRGLMAGGLQQTAALFVGVPALIAVVIVLVVAPRSAVGTACKAVTVGLLVSLIVLGEGFLCVGMSAPLFYLVAVVVGLSVDRTRQGELDPFRSAFSSVALLAVLSMSVEGVMPLTSFPREERVVVRRTVAAPAEAVARALRRPPRFDRPVPWIGHMGFPLPIAARLAGTADGPRLIVRVRGGEMRIDGMEPRAGDLVLALASVQPGRLRWTAISDDSHMTHFLDWRGSTVEWRALGPTTTEVTWTLEYRRGLDPAWYFGPMQRVAARLAAGYLIEAVATP